MVNITLSVPEDLKKKMDEAKFINWSEVAREAIREKMKQLQILESISKKSNLTEKDAEEIGRKIKKDMLKKYKEEK